MFFDLSRDELATYVDTTFRVVDDPALPLDLRLTEVSPLRETARQRMFSLFFHGPPDRFLPQMMHKLVHEQLGEVDLFLVPVGQDEGGFIYEAVFNRMINTSSSQSTTSGG